MKNLIVLDSRAAIHEYVGALWKSDMFRESYHARGFVYEVVNRFAWLPRLFCEMSNDYLERPHFATWWNVIVLRNDYANPIIHDLYYLHEFAHAASMPYVPDIGRAAFDEKMQRNELEASVLSEIQVYFEMPGLREASFDHEIYADQFLKDPHICSLWKANREVAVETIRSIRRDIMTSKAEHLMDDSEKWIRRYADLNTAYSITWTDHYNEIEEAMARLQAESAHDRRAAMRHYCKWIEDKAALDPVDNIPYRLEAELFAPFYWANKMKYSAAMKA